MARPRAGSAQVKAAGSTATQRCSAGQRPAVGGVERGGGEALRPSGPRLADDHVPSPTGRRVDAGGHPGEHHRPLVESAAQPPRQSSAAQVRVPATRSSAADGVQVAATRVRRSCAATAGEDPQSVTGSRPGPQAKQVGNGWRPGPGTTPRRRGPRRGTGATGGSVELGGACATGSPSTLRRSSRRGPRTRQRHVERWRPAQPHLDDRGVGRVRREGGRPTSRRCRSGRGRGSGRRSPGSRRARPPQHCRPGGAGGQPARW